MARFITSPSVGPNRHLGSHALPHGSVTGRGPGVVMASIRLSAEAASPGVARRLVANVLRGMMSPADIKVVVLLTSEVVTNAVVHAGTSIGLVVRRIDEGVQIEVSDGDKHIPVVDDRALDSTSGHGMSLVALLSQRWAPSPPRTARRSGFAARIAGRLGPVCAIRLDLTAAADARQAVNAAA